MIGLQVFPQGGLLARLGYARVVNVGGGSTLFPLGT